MRTIRTPQYRTQSAERSTRTPGLVRHAYSIGVRSIRGQRVPAPMISIRRIGPMVALSLASLLFPVTLVKAQSTTTQINSGSIKSFSVNAGSSFSVNTSATSSPGVKATADGNAVLSKDSSLTTGVTCNGINCSAAWTQTTGSNSFLIQGSHSEQKLYLDPSSVFKTSVDTSQATQTTNQNSGSASAGFTANTSLTVTEQQSTFSNTFINTF